MDIIVALFQLVGAYLIGSVPTGVLVAHLKGVRNIYEYGSGNIGATNVARVLGFHYFFLVFLLDGAKAFGYIWLLCYWGTPLNWLLLCCAAVLLGNTRSLFLRFKGGKGVATSFGLLLAVFPVLLVLVFPVWIATLLVTRMVGIASVVALLVAPFFALILRSDVSMIIFVSVVCLWCIFLHRNNIKRFWNRSASKGLS